MPTNTNTPIYQDPRKGLSKLKGINALPESNRKSFEEQAVKAGLLPKKYSNSQADRLYRDVQYINEFGIDDFTSTPDYNMRDSKYRGAVINSTAQEVFKDIPYQDKSIIFGDERIGYTGLDSDSLLELMQSGYKNEDELNDLRKEIDSKKEEYNKGGKGKKLRDILSTTGNPYTDAKNKDTLEGDSYEQALESTYDNALAINKSALEKAQFDTAQRRNAELAPEANKLTNYIESKVSDFKVAEDIYNEALKSGDVNNVDTAVKYLLDSGIITKEWASGVSKLGVEDKLNVVGQFFQQSEFNPKQIDNLFNKVAEKQEIRDENTGELIGELPGSGIYQSGKRSLNNLSAHDKLYQWAMWQTAAQKYGIGTAISQLDSNLAEISQNNEDLWDHTTDVVINIGFGGLANIMNKVNGVLNLAASIKGEEALSNRLQGKKISGEERIQNESGSTLRWMWDNAFNPQYWSKVDEYNTLDPMEINRIESLGGISPYTTTTIPGQDIKFFSRKTLDEALKMTKFLWSDYLTGQLVSAPFMWGAQKAGQLSSLGKTLGKVGAAASVLSSAVGISESYGMMTFDSAYEEAMAASALKQNEAIDNYINEQLSQEDVSKEIDKRVRDISFQQALSGETNVNVGAIKKQVTDEYKGALEQQWLLLNQEEIAKDKDRALDAATEAYMVDATIEQIRMSGINALFRKYLFTPQVRRILGDSNRFSKDIIRNGVGDISVKKGVVPYLKNMGKLVFSGFESNYFDDVTVGFGKGFGLGKYNAYLEEKYNGFNTADAADYAYNFVSGLSGALDNAGEALLDRQSFYDGFVGGIGVPLSGMVRTSGSERSSARETLGLKQGEKVKNVGQWLYLNMKNPLMDAYYETKAGIRNTEEVIPLIQKFITEKGDALKDIEKVVSSARKSENALGNGELIDIIDAKNNEAYQLINALYGAKYSPIIDEFQEIKDFLGVIDEFSKGKISEDNITAFLAQPENRSLASLEESRQIARDRIQENAQALKKMAQTITDANSILDNLKDVGDEKDAMEREQLVYMLAMEDAWKTRVNKMEDRLSGNTVFAENGSLYERIRNQISKKLSRNPIAEYGSEAGIEREIKANISYYQQLSEDLKSLDAKIASTKKNIKEANRFRSKDDIEGIRTLNQDLLLYQLQYNKLREEVEQVKDNIKRAEKSRGIFESSPVLSKNEILALDPVSREKMLVKTERYSEEQQREINSLKDDLNANVGSDYMSLVIDESRLYKRIEENRKAYNRISKNPGAALAYVNNIKRQQGNVARTAEYLFQIDKEFGELDNAQSPEALFDIAKNKLIQRDSYLNTSTLDTYIKIHKDKEEALKPLLELSKLRDNLDSAIDVVFKDTDGNSYSEFRKAVKASFAEEIANANSGDEAMLALENLLDRQTDERIKDAYNRILDGAAEIGVQRNATMQRNREEEKKRREEEARKKAEEKAKLDGKNYGWDKFKVGDSVYNENGDFVGIVSAFKVEDSMLVEKKNANGVTTTQWYEASKYKDKFLKEQRKKEEQKEVKSEVKEESVEEEDLTVTDSVWEQVSGEDIDLSPVDEDGATESPDAELQAKADDKNYVTYTDSDALFEPSEERVEIHDGVLSGNRYQQYSYESLKQGIVKEEVPEVLDSVFAELVGWLKSNNIRLQDIIDEEFSKIILEKPDTKIRFMMLPTQKAGVAKSNSLESTLINVIEFDRTAQKYHKQKNGGVTTDSSGKQWLVVGITGFAKNSTAAQRKSYVETKEPISNRRFEYFKKNPSAKFYVDENSYTTVKDFTSGNLVKQTLGMESMELRPVSKLMEMNGKTLEDAQFGIQTRKANGTRGFVVSSGVKTDTLYPPKDSEGNVGRVFILIDTPNGNKIPAYIEAPMFNKLGDNTPLKSAILKILNEQILNSNYEARLEGIKRLCGYLVLKKEGNNILIGNKDVNTVTIQTIEKRPSGNRTKSVTFNMSNFNAEDRQRFFKTLEEANFETNITFRNLDDVDILRMYDESNALMTNIASLNTVGSTYTVFPVDKTGKPIETNIDTPSNIDRVQTEVSEPRRTVRVNNVDYEFNSDSEVFVTTTEKEVIKAKDPVKWNTLYLNLQIKEGNWSPVLVRGLDSYYQFPNKKGEDTIAKVNNLGEVKFLSTDEQAKIRKEIENIQKEEYIERLKGKYEDVDLGEQQEPLKTEEIDLDTQIQKMQQQIIGEPVFTERQKAEEEAPKKEEEVKEKNNIPISTTADGTAKSLVNSVENGNFTLEEAMGDFMNPKFEELASVLEDKGLGDLSAVEITKKLNLPSAFKDIDTIIDIIKNCR